MSENNENLKYFEGTIKLVCATEKKKLNSSSEEILNRNLSEEEILTLEQENNGIADIVQQQQISKQENTNIETKDPKDNKEDELYTIKRDEQDRIKQIDYYRLNKETKNKELAYIEFFNYNNITERDIASSLYKPDNEEPKEQVYNKNLIGNRFYKNGINAEHIEESDYLTNVYNIKNCHENTILETNPNIKDANGNSFKKEVDCESFLYEFFKNEFKNEENNQISGKYFKSLIAYQIIQNNIEKEQNKQEKTIRSILKNEELKKLDDIENELTTQIDNLKNKNSKLVEYGVNVSNLKNTNNTNMDEKKEEETNKIGTWLFSSISSSTESTQNETEEQIKNQLVIQRKNLIRKINKAKADKIEEINKLRINILNNKSINLTEEQLKILNKQNNKTLYFNNLTEIRNSNNEYFKELCNDHEIEQQGKRKDEQQNITEYFLNELLLGDYIDKDQIIIIPIDLNAHATVMLIDTQNKKSYLFDSSLYNCENGKAQNILFKQYTNEIELLNKHSIQVNGCCTYWSMSFINTIVNNENGKYNTIEQIQEASKNGQLQLDAAIEMEKIFGEDNQIIKYSNNEQDINEEDYIKIKLNNNNFYGINKNVLDNKFLKLEGIKEYCNDYITNENQRKELDNMIKCQKCLYKANDIFKYNEQKGYSLSDKNILIINDFINVLQNDTENKLKDKDKKEADIENLKKIENEKNQIKEQMKKQIQQGKNVDELITQYNNKLKEQQTIFNNYNLKNYNCDIQVTKQSDDYTEEEKSILQTHQSPDKEIRNKIIEQFKCFNTGYTNKVSQEETTKQQQLSTTAKKIEKTRFL